MRTFHSNFAPPGIGSLAASTKRARRRLPTGTGALKRTLLKPALIPAPRSVIAIVLSLQCEAVKASEIRRDLQPEPSCALNGDSRAARSVSTGSIADRGWHLRSRRLHVASLNQSLTPIRADFGASRSKCSDHGGRIAECPLRISPQLISRHRACFCKLAHDSAEILGRNRWQLLDTGPHERLLDQPSQKAFHPVILFRRLCDGLEPVLLGDNRPREVWKRRLRKATPSLIALGSAAVIALVAVYVLRDRRSMLSEWRDYIPWKQ